MPQVPVYGGPQVAADPLRPVQARALDVSSGTRQLAQGLANLAEGIDRYQETKAQIRANEIETNLTDEYNRWADTEQPKAINQNASTWRSRVEAWWEDAKGRYGKDLDPYAARKVTEILARRRSIALNEAGRYQSVQEERYADSTAFSAMESAASSAVRSGAYDVELGRTRDLVYEMAARKSLDKDQRDALMAEQVGKFHRRVIDNLSAEQGLAYYDANAADIEDKRLRDTLERQVEIEQKQREQEAKQAKADAEDAAMNQALTLYANNDKVPPSLMTTLAPRDRIQLQSMIETRAQGREVKTDIATYLELNDAIGRGEPVDLRKYSNAISTSDLKGLAKKQGKSQQDGFLTDEQRQNKALLDLGIDKKTQGEEAYAVLGLIDQRTREASAAKGNKPLTPDEKQAVIDSVVLDNVYVNSNWVRADPQKPAALLSPEETAGAYVMVNDKAVLLSVVPADKRMAIISARRARGLPVTEQAIVETYLRKYPNGQ